jgi:hypothetical protein
LQLKWRSVGTQPQVFNIDLGKRRLISYFLLYKHNLTYSATIHFQAAIDANFNTIVIDETFKATKPLYGFGQRYGLNYGGFSNENWITKSTIKWLAKTFVQYIRVTITDINNPDGYLEIGRMKSGEYFQGVFNMRWGYARDLLSNSKVVESRSLARFVEVKPQQQMFFLGFDYLNAAEEQAIYKMQAQCDKANDVFFSAYPLINTTEERLHQALCFFDSWGKVPRSSLNFRAWDVTLKESI